MATVAVTAAASSAAAVAALLQGQNADVTAAAASAEVAALAAAAGLSKICLPRTQTARVLRSSPSMRNFSSASWFASRGKRSKGPLTGAKLTCTASKSLPTANEPIVSPRASASAPPCVPK
eukprot:Amastigsp_a842163_35.p4 type:complete len:121 gc:universal Amastigsp_a842163_35:1497-1135(-)